MQELLKSISVLTAEEYARATEKFGHTHNSSHEAYAVLEEEVEEAMVECEALQDCMETYWDEVKGNNKDEQRAQLIWIMQYAGRAAAELIQVAAMARKAIRTLEESK